MGAQDQRLVFKILGLSFSGQGKLQGLWRLWRAAAESVAGFQVGDRCFENGIITPQFHQVNVVGAEKYLAETSVDATKSCACCRTPRCDDSVDWHKR